MVHQNFQEAIAQLSMNEGMNCEEIKSHFNLNDEDMKAMKSYDPLIQGKTTPDPGGWCCCCI